MNKILTGLFLLLFFSTNLLFGQSWSEQVSGVTVQLTSVSATGGTFAWICGYNGTVLRTTNNGVLWTNVSGNGIPNTVQLVTIAAIDINTAVTAGYIGTTTYAYRTSNAGATWTQVFTQANGFIDAVCMTTNTAGFMAGDPVNMRWSFWKTTNGGVNWDSTGLYLPAATASEAGWNNSMFCSQNNIWLGTNNSRIYYSTNNGTNWIVQSTGIHLNSYSLWFFAQTNEGLAGTDSLLVSSNSGTNWNVQTSVGTGNINGIAGAGVIVNNAYFGNLWYVRSDNKIYNSFGGGNWQVQYTAPGSGTYRYLFGAQSGGVFGPFWALRTDGGISYMPQITDIHLVSREVPASFSLSQNYPNPFNPATNINFSIPKSSFVNLVVYDILGREVKTIVNENLQPGTYKIDFDGSKYSSGVYFYRINSGAYSEIKRMVLIK